MTFGDDFFKTVLDDLLDGVYVVDQDRRIVYWNKGAERISGFSAREVLGAHCFDNLLQHVDGEGCQMCTGECPLAAAIQDGNPREADIYLQHKEGHRVPVWVRVSPVRDAEGHITGAVESFTENSSRADAIERLAKLQEVALLDPVTGVGNRRYLEARLRAALDGFQRYGWNFGMLFLDVDHFKQVNDKYGHDTGDRVLRMVARTLGGRLRASDSLGRWGGEEFLALISNTNAENLRATAERSRKMVAQSSLELGVSRIEVTISIGATMVRAGDTPDSLLDRADRLMYQAKTLGRNRVEGEPPLSSTVESRSSV